MCLETFDEFDYSAASGEQPVQCHLKLKSLLQRVSRVVAAHAVAPTGVNPFVALKQAQADFDEFLNRPAKQLPLLLAD
ncbi:MAG TPA: hypothetical protein VN541_25170 [Tepidisphaeraceae bacterium]|nr:hypothetical protein [Tepidisphaeraceae bacterium]